MAQFDVNGEENWMTLLPEERVNEDYWFDAMTVDDEGNVYVGIVPYVYGQRGYEGVRVLLLKLDPDGNVLWTDSIDDTTPCIPPEEDADDGDDFSPCGCGGREGLRGRGSGFGWEGGEGPASLLASEQVVRALRTEPCSLSPEP